MRGWDAVSLQRIHKLTLRLLKFTSFLLLQENQMLNNKVIFFKKGLSHCTLVALNSLRIDYGQISTSQTRPLRFAEMMNQ
uniref:Uncharacterized protein n=1 Tax=Salix viminalis TaxID=40686 RepID=A0A6N2MJY9_SALVM